MDAPPTEEHLSEKKSEESARMQGNLIAETICCIEIEHDVVFFVVFIFIYSHKLLQ